MPQVELYKHSLKPSGQLKNRKYKIGFKETYNVFLLIYELFTQTNYSP